MSGPQCCSNPPTLNPSAGAGHVEQLGGLSSYISGSADSKRAVLLVSDVFGTYTSLQLFFSHFCLVLYSHFKPLSGSRCWFLDCEVLSFGFWGLTWFADEMVVEFIHFFFSLFWVMSMNIEESSLAPSVIMGNSLSLEFFCSRELDFIIKKNPQKDQILENQKQRKNVGILITTEGWKSIFSHLWFCSEKF